MLHRPLVQLMQRDFGAPETMRQALLDYCRAAYTDGAEETVPAETLAARLEDALRNARRNFSITLARRGEFSATVVSADWGEAGNWDLLLGLAEQRLNGG